MTHLVPYAKVIWQFQFSGYLGAIFIVLQVFKNSILARQIVEKGLRDLSNQLVYRECCALNRPELVEFCRDKLLTQKTQMKILTRSPSQPLDESDERIKKEINKLRNVCKVIRTGNVAMDVLTDDDPVSSFYVTFYVILSFLKSDD